jgi:hypothetical protein
MKDSPILILSDKVHGIEDLMGKTLTGIGHKPWRGYNEAERVVIADGEPVRVTPEAYEAVKFSKFNSETHPRTRYEGGHYIWDMEPILFDDWANDKTSDALSGMYEIGELVEVRKRDEEQWSLKKYHGHFMLCPGQAVILAGESDSMLNIPSEFYEIRKYSTQSNN